MLIFLRFAAKPPPAIVDKSRVLSMLRPVLLRPLLCRGKFLFWGRISGSYAGDVERPIPGRVSSCTNDWCYSSVENTNIRISESQLQFISWCFGGIKCCYESCVLFYRFYCFGKSNNYYVVISSPMANINIWGKFFACSFQDRFESERRQKSATSGRLSPLLFKLICSKMRKPRAEKVAYSVAPYCAIPRDYLSDTPLLRAMGFWCLNMANWVRYPSSFSEHFPPWRACEV